MNNQGSITPDRRRDTVASAPASVGASTVASLLRDYLLVVNRVAYSRSNFHRHRYSAVQSSELAALIDGVSKGQGVAVSVTCVEQRPSGYASSEGQGDAATYCDTYHPDELPSAHTLLYGLP